MKQVQDTLVVNTHATGFYEITDAVRNFVSQSGVNNGLLTMLIQHTSASLTIQENADPDVCLDLTDALDRIAPKSRDLYRHDAEGPDDMPAHIKAALTDVSLSVPIMDGQPRLGMWQGIYVIEHRDRAHTRRVAVHLIGS